LYSAKEISFQNEKFWTRMGQYMAPILSTNGEKINWINYKTGVAKIQVRLQADISSASMGIYIHTADEHLHARQWQTFLHLRESFEQHLQEKWDWKSATEAQQNFSTICVKITNVNVMDDASWPTLIPFFKQRLVRFDLFWTEHKDLFTLTG